MTIAQCFGVFGHPIGHSRSPAMHSAAFAQLGLPHRYLAFDVEPAGLGDALRGAAALGFGGVNLTVPHKRSALRWMDELSPEAEALGAVNTVCFTGAGLRGCNTDGAGFLEGARALGPEIVDGSLTRPAVVLGGGGAARAVVHALLGQGMGVVWASRSPESLPAWSGVRPSHYRALSEALQRARLLVNATSVGMKGGPTTFPIAIDLHVMPADAAVIDLVYPRPPAGLLVDAARRGLRVQDGLPMLCGQGVLALEQWLARPLPLAAREAMSAALGLS